MTSASNVVLTAAFRWVVISLLAGAVFVGSASGGQGGGKGEAHDRPPVNPYLSAPLYGITHFDSSQSDSTPYGPPRGVYYVDPSTQPIVYGGPTNIITLASTKPDYMWQVGSDRVSYVYKGDGRWRTLTSYQALADASTYVVPPIVPPLAPIPDANFLTFGESSAVGMTTTTMNSLLGSLFGSNYALRFGNGVYVLVDKDNVLYAPYQNTIFGFALTDPDRPSAGITVRYQLNDVITTFQGSSPTGAPRVSGLSMTYDGHIVITFSNGVGVIDRDLNPASKSFYQFASTEYVSNSIAIDENNGIYVASGNVPRPTPPPYPTNGGTMHKLVWTGTTLSDKESDGAWSSPYESSGSYPPIIKVGNGTGSTPTLMGFGDDPDKLVVITDGAEDMNLVAFWRNEIPEGFVQQAGTLSRRIAGQIPVTCGFTSPLPTWIQSEQSVVVYGYGAFVVNNIPQTVSSDIQSASKLLQVSLMGPAYPTSYGAERFQWNPSTHAWSSVWGRSDVSSTSMVPIHSQSGSMALINGYRSPNGWEVLGLDWNTGRIVHQTIFGNTNFGNGAYAILQYLESGDLLFNSESGDLLFNSICGTFRVHYRHERTEF